MEKWRAAHGEELLVVDGGDAGDLVDVRLGLRVRVHEVHGDADGQLEARLLPLEACSVCDTEAFYDTYSRYTYS